MIVRDYGRTVHFSFCATVPWKPAMSWQLAEMSASLEAPNYEK